MRSPDLLLGVLEEIRAGGIDSNAALQQLLKLAKTDGFLPTELHTILDGVLDPSISTTHKNILASDCLLPKEDTLIPTDIVGRILGAIGTPEIYYKNGKQHKLKRLALLCQQRLLEWLVCALPMFGFQIFRSLRRFLPILFGLLSFEFLRPYIATLIAAAAIGPDAVPTEVSGFVIRPWHVQLVVDLYEQFPTDPSLGALLALFRMRNRIAKTQLSQISGSQSADASKVFVYPNRELHAQLLAKYLLSDVKEVESQMQRFFRSFDAQKLKKRKIDTTPYELFFSEKSNAVLILSINSVNSLIHQFEKVALTNPSSVLSVTTSGNNRFRCLFLALYLITAGQHDKTLEKLGHAIRYHILNPGERKSPLVFSQLIEFARFQGLNRLSEPCIRFLNSTMDPDAETVESQIRLLRYIPWEKSVIVSALIKVFASLRLFKNAEWTSLIGLMYVELAFIIRKADVLHQNGPNLTGKDYLSFLDTLLQILIPTFAFTETMWPRLSLVAQIKFLLVLGSVKLIRLDPWPDAGQLVPPPSLMYQMVVATNPLVLSEALGYLAFLKNVPLPQENKMLALRNAYVMDSINFLWRDMALKLEPQNFSQGMFLDSDFLHRIGALNFFSSSELLQLKNVGGLIRNPGFLYICAELVWKLEDQAENITTRHPGPISEESVAQLRLDPNVKWLLMTYYDIKTSLVNSLDELGYTGLGDLLFTSLKPLANKRHSDHVH